MLDIKYIKENKNEFDQALIKRGMEPCGSEIIIKHNEYLNLLNKKQKLQEERNRLTKSFKDSSNIDDLRKQVLLIKKDLDELNNLSEKNFNELTNTLLNIPNIVDIKTPEGLNEKENREIKSYGKKGFLISNL